MLITGVQMLALFLAAIAAAQATAPACEDGAEACIRGDHSEMLQQRVQAHQEPPVHEGEPPEPPAGLPPSDSEKTLLETEEQTRQEPPVHEGEPPEPPAGLETEDDDAPEETLLETEDDDDGAAPDPLLEAEEEDEARALLAEETSERVVPGFSKWMNDYKKAQKALEKKSKEIAEKNKKLAAEKKAKEAAKKAAEKKAKEAAEKKAKEEAEKKAHQEYRRKDYKRLYFTREGKGCPKMRYNKHVGCVEPDIVHEKTNELCVTPETRWTDKVVLAKPAKELVYASTKEDCMRDMLLATECGDIMLWHYPTKSCSCLAPDQKCEYMSKFIYEMKAAPNQAKILLGDKDITELVTKKSILDMDQQESMALLRHYRYQHVCTTMADGGREGPFYPKSGDGYCASQMTPKGNRKLGLFCDKRKGCRWCADGCLSCDGYSRCKRCEFGYELKYPAWCEKLHKCVLQSWRGGGCNKGSYCDVRKGCLDCPTGCRTCQMSDGEDADGTKITGIKKYGSLTCNSCDAGYQRVKYGVIAYENDFKRDNKGYTYKVPVHEYRCEKPNAPAAGGTCADPDPKAKGRASYDCPAGYKTPSANVTQGKCDSVSSCNKNCCKDMDALIKEAEDEYKSGKFKLKLDTVEKDMKDMDEEREELRQKSISKRDYCSEVYKAFKAWWEKHKEVIGDKVDSIIDLEKRHRYCGLHYHWHR